MTLPILELGDRVRRGPTWGWGNQDGNGFGTFVKYRSTYSGNFPWVKIKWDSGTEDVYRYGGIGKYQDVVLVKEQNLEDNLFLKGF